MERRRIQVPKGSVDHSRREFLEKSAKSLAAVGAAAVVTGIAGEVGKAIVDQEVKKEREVSRIHREVMEKTFEDMHEPVEPNPFFDDNPEYLTPLTEQNGEWSDAEREARTETLKNGEVIFRDAGLVYYQVQKSDLFSLNRKKKIRKRLACYAEFSYLEDLSQNMLLSFNIPGRHLEDGMWIPIPTRESDRELSDAQFIQYAGRALDEMKVHAEYGEVVQRIIDKVGERELIAYLVGIAKQEGGGRPLGQFVLHRWEQKYKVFSYSLFHVMMMGPGLEARQKLNLTEGQLYHPQNAVKLFLAFMVEKAPEFRRQADDFFPIAEHAEDFARFYNGGKWKTRNPDYLDNIARYVGEADNHLSTDGRRWSKESLAE